MLRKFALYVQLQASIRNKAVNTSSPSMSKIRFTGKKWALSFHWRLKWITKLSCYHLWEVCDSFVNTSHKHQVPYHKRSLTLTNDSNVYCNYPLASEELLIALLRWKPTSSVRTICIFTWWYIHQSNWKFIPNKFTMKTVIL